MKRVVLIAVLVLAVAGCASDRGGSHSSAESTTSTAPTSTTIPAEPAAAFTVQESGGCMMMGPNCSVYRFWTDGKVDLIRVDISGAPEASSAIDPELVDNVISILDSADLDALRASLPEGECRGCYDGIDTIYIYEVGSQSVAFDSTKVELLTSVPLFAATDAAYEAALEALGPINVEQRTG